MKNMICDICGCKILTDTDLIELIANAKIDGVSEVCRSCLGEITQQSAKLSSIAAEMKLGWLRKWIGNFKISKAIP